MKLPLKAKLTITSIIILTVMCMCLTITANYAASSLSNAMNTAPAQNSSRISTPQQREDLKDAATTQDVATTQNATITQDAITKAATTKFHFTTIYAMIVLIGVGSVLTYIYASKTLKPLEQLTETANHININNLDENIPLPNTGDEVERLTKSFNDMTTKLNASYQVQKNFSANAAHELRTPLATIQTQLDVFELKTDRNPTEYTALIKSVSQSTERLSNLVNDLLSFTNEQDVDMTKSVDLHGLIEEIIFELEENAKAKNIKIILEGEGEIFGSDGLLQRAFYNLISNAIRYNVDGGNIAITISNKKVTVADTGVGIPEEAKPNIFNTFFCVDKSRSRELGGSGLGLAIVKNIIEKHGGSIYVEDNKPQGSIFIVMFEKF